MIRRIVLVGAARSGTKIMRDALAVAASIGRVPYDVGFVWRYGSESVSHDALDPAAVNPRARAFITSYLDEYASNGVVLEKTVGNTLRVPYVRAVLGDDVSFIHLVRDGTDVAESTRRQWQAPPDRRYLLRKLRHFPARLALGYGRKYAASLAERYRSGQSRVGSWGPRYPGIDEDLTTEPLLTVCARQWKHSVECATAAFKAHQSSVVTLRYEDLVAHPGRSLRYVINELGLGTDDRLMDEAVSMIRPGRVGAGSASLSLDERRMLEVEIGDTLQRWGYQSPIEGE